MLNFYWLIGLSSFIDLRWLSDLVRRSCCVMIIRSTVSWFVYQWCHLPARMRTLKVAILFCIFQSWEHTICFIFPPTSNRSSVIPGSFTFGVSSLFYLPVTVSLVHWFTFGRVRRFDSTSASCTVWKTDKCKKSEYCTEYFLVSGQQKLCIIKNNC